MTPEVRLYLLEQELIRWMADESPDRDRVHADRSSRILSMERTQQRVAS